MAEPTQRENDKGTIAAELLKLLGVIAGLGLSPLLANRTGWFWAIGMAAGGLVLLAGAVLSLALDRKARRKRLEKLRERLLQETTLLQATVQVHKEPQFDPEMVFANPRLASLRARLEAGWISEREFNAQAGEILNEIAMAEEGEKLDYQLPASVIALGIFIILPAVIALLVIANRIDQPAEIAAYFSSPALLLWMAVEAIQLIEIYREQPWKIYQLLAWLSSLLHVLAGLALWVYMGLFFGERQVIWVLILGASLAVLGALLRFIGLFTQRRAERQEAAREHVLLPGSPEREPAHAPTNGGEQFPAVAETEDGKPEAAISGARQPSRARFEIFEGKDGKYYFRLRAGNGEIILASQGYKSLRGCRKGIRSVQANAGLPERYDRRATQSGEPYFVLLAANNQVIGRSESYSSETAREGGIKAVISNGRNASVKKTEVERS